MNDFSDKNKVDDLSRRSFLLASVGSSLLLAFGALTTTGEVFAGSAAQALANKNFSPTVWFEINDQGKILINIAKAEMGQHIGTALARIVCDELGGNWQDVTIKHVDSDPKWGYMVTGGSWSVFQSFNMLSQAGAAGRIALIEAGAKMLGKEVIACSTKNGQVICGDSAITFAEIVRLGHFERSFTPEQLAALPIKPAQQRNLIGQASPALDIPDKINGVAKFGLDVEIEGMVYARPIIPPTRYGSQISAVDDSEAKTIKGYLGYHLLKDPSETLQAWISVVADNVVSAIKAAEVIKVSYLAGPTANINEADILSEGTRLTEDNSAGYLYVDDGDVERAFSSAATKVEAKYTTSSVLHFQMEPVNATAEFKEGIWHIHCGCQWQSLILPVIAKALAVEENKVLMHQYYLGGGFGRRLFADYAIPAALTAKAINKPVKMVFTRPDDARLDCIRSPSVQAFKGSLDDKGTFTGMEHAAAAGWPTLSMAPGFMPESLDKKGRVDPFSISGADHWYSLANHRVRAINNDLAQRTFLPGWLRAVGPGWIGWGVESFIDEVAIAANSDPLAFRLKLLDGKGKNAGKSPESVGGATRLANVLKALKTQANWGQKFTGNEGMGLAIAAGQERTMPTWTACAAHVLVDKKSGKVTVKKLFITVDCGTAVHPDGALAQMEGSALWGLSLALHEGTKIEKGQVAATNLDTYTPLRMADVPALDIQFLPSTEMPVGLGEPGLIAVAPAIANAIYAAVGARVRDIPIRAEAVLKALNG